ncbi:hypothetical protein GCM10028777_15460 [Angustibacter speluncae]
MNVPRPLLAACAAVLVALAGLVPAGTASAEAGAGDAVGPGGVVSLAPARLLDTRTTSAVPAMGTRTLQVTGRAGVPAADVAAVVLNVTAVAPSAGGYLTAYPAGTARPTASNLNYLPGQATPNTVVVKVGDGGAVALFNGSPGSTHLLVDVAGYVVGGTATAPGSVVALAPSRLVDTRTAAAVPALGTLDVQVAGHGDVPAGVAAVLLNVTAVAPGTGGYLTAYPQGTARPTTSNVNYLPGRTTAGSAVVKVGASGRISLFNGSPGATHLLVDVAGYVLAGDVTAPGGLTAVDPARLLDTRDGTGAVPAMGTLVLQVTGRGGVPATDVAAVVLTVTAVTPAAGGYLTAYPDGTTRPTASNLNYLPGQTTPNTVVVKVGTGGRVALFNGSASPVHLLADVAAHVRPGRGQGSWVTTAVPGASQVHDVACSSATSCVAAATAAPASWDAVSQAVAVEVDGDTTRATRLALPAGVPASTPSSAWSVACGTGLCLVASTLGGSAPDAFTSVRTAGTWGAARTVTVPAGGRAPVPADVDCTAGGACVLVGSYTDAGGATRLLAEHLASGTWTQPAVPTPADVASGLELTDVDCAAADSCTAVGRYRTTAGEPRLLTARYAGGAWTTTTTGFSAPASGFVHQPVVACPTTTTCVLAVSHSRADAEQTTATLLGRSVSGAAWQLADAGVGTDQVAVVQAVDCGTSTTCSAVGTTFDPVTGPGPLVRRWAAGSWGTDGGPAVPGASLTDVSCVDATTCVATGYGAQPLVATRSASGWSAADVSPTWPHEDAIAQAVACAGGRCTVVGDALRGSTGTAFVVR